MQSSIIETTYPLTFREADAKALAEQLERRHSVELVGMKRVGINNFLRFFLFHEGIKKKYFSTPQNHLFISVDLNDLIERELFPFWRLTFKRIVDAVDESAIDAKIKEKISDLFARSIQTGDLFLTYDGVRNALSTLVKADFLPTIFFTRFDRLSDVITADFFGNLEALKDATNDKVSFVFTSYKDLDTIAKESFERKSFSTFSTILYIKPAKPTDMEVIFESIAKRYEVGDGAFQKPSITLSGGHVQYLQLCLIVLRELKQKEKTVSQDAFEKAVMDDERVALQSEELWESLTTEEKDILEKVAGKKEITEKEKDSGYYLWESGFVEGKTIFSPLLAHFAVGHEGKEEMVDGSSIELSKKEHMLFKLLDQYPNEIVERETIVEQVWPEYSEYGVSDWSVDRLVARLRGKLKQQKNTAEITTIRTRGYKLITK